MSKLQRCYRYPDVVECRTGGGACQYRRDRVLAFSAQGSIHEDYRRASPAHKTGCEAASTAHNRLRTVPTGQRSCLAA